MTDWDILSNFPKFWEMSHADCSNCIYSAHKSNMLACTWKHADVTDRGILPCTHYEPHKVKDGEKTPMDKEFLVTLSVTGEATVRLRAKDEDEAQIAAMERIRNAFDACTTLCDLECETEEVEEVKR